MHQRAFLGSSWGRGGVAGSGVVRRACPASGAQWNVQVVRGKVNGKCLWNACKALSLGLLLMVLGAAMATIGYYADDLSIAQEIKGNHTVSVRNESRGFHLSNLSYAGPMVMGVGGFIVVAACVMTFEARDSAAKVVPARFKLSSSGRPAMGATCGRVSHGGSAHGSLRTSGSQTAAQQPLYIPDRRAVTQSFLQFSKELDTRANRSAMLGVPHQPSINKSPSAPDLVRDNSQERTSPVLFRKINEKPSPKNAKKTTFGGCTLLNPRLLHRHALSVDETGANYRTSHDSLQASGSQGSMTMDLHLEYPVTLRVKDRRRNPLRRQRRVDEDVNEESSRRSSHSCSPRIPSHPAQESIAAITGGSAHQLPTHYSAVPHHHSGRRRSSNASDCTHRSRAKRRDCPHTARGRLERAISSDSRLTGAVPKCRHHRYSPTRTSTEQEPGASCSDTDIHSAQVHVNFSDSKQ